MKKPALKRLPQKNAEEMLRRLECLKTQIDEIYREVESIRIESLKKRIKALK